MNTEQEGESGVDVCTYIYIYINIYLFIYYIYYIYIYIYIYISGNLSVMEVQLPTMSCVWVPCSAWESNSQSNSGLYTMGQPSWLYVELMISTTS